MRVIPVETARRAVSTLMNAHDFSPARVYNARMAARRYVISGHVQGVFFRPPQEAAHRSLGGGGRASLRIGHLLLRPTGRASNEIR